jgi:carbohydrate kinase (thermoresistant glucokinase family)
MVYILIGVSGCGKTTIGRILSERLAIKFYDADDFHSHNNITKMKKLIPLDDVDRIPWLLKVAEHIAEWNRDEDAVLACSALKEKYRQILSWNGKEKVVFIYLEGNKNIILERMKKRKKHFFSLELLESQFNTLEIPLNGITVQIDKTPEEICTEIINKIVSNGFALPVDLERIQNG